MPKVTGKIADSKNAPLASKRIILRDAAGVEVEVQSTANGDYSFANVNMGAYDVVFPRIAGHQTPALAAVNMAAANVAVGTTQYAAVAAPAAGAPTGSIVVVVTDPAAAAVANATVTATLAGAATIEAGADPVVVGTYIVENLPPGAYNVDAKAPGLALPAVIPTPVAAAAVNVSAQLRPLAAPAPAPAPAPGGAPGSITGRVTDAAGAAVAGATVTASLAGVPSPSVQSDAAGMYTIPNLPAPGAYSVSAVAPKLGLPAPLAAAVAPGAPTPLNIQLQSTTGTVNGLVSGQNGQGLANTVVTATETVTRVVTASRATNAMGRYTIEDLAPGVYDLEAQVPGGVVPPILGVNVVTGPNLPRDFALPADTVATFLDAFNKPQYDLESKVSMAEASYAASYFRVANIIFAGLTESPVLDLFGSQRASTLATELGIRESDAAWTTVLGEVENLKRLISDRVGTQSILRLRQEAKRQFNLGVENSVAANVRFPTLFRRYVEIATDPLLSMDIADQEKNNPLVDRTRIGEADALLRELKDVVIQMVKSLSREGKAANRLETETWVPVAQKATEIADKLGQLRKTGDADDQNPWAVVSVLTAKDRDTEVTPYIVLGRHGGRLLELAINMYQALVGQGLLTSFDQRKLRDVFQDPRSRNTDTRSFFTDLIREQATYVKNYPLPNWG